MSSASYLSCEGLGFAYPGGRELLKGLNLGLDGNTLTLLSGENGCGKSTLLKLLCGDLSPTAGEVMWKGKPLPKDRTGLFQQLWHLEQEAANQRIGICPRHDLEIWQMALRARHPLNLWQTAAKRLNLDPDRLDMPWHQLSSGDARAATLMPLIPAIGHFWLLDEPMVGLDKDRVSGVLQICEEKLRNGVGMLIVTHDPDVYKDLPHRHIELRAGSLWELG